MRTTAILLALLGALIALAACATPDRAGAPLRAPESVAALEGHWDLVAIEGRPAENLEAIGVPRSPHIVIADNGAAAGFAGVNRYSTRLVLDDAGAAFFAPVVSTKMAGHPEANALEMRFLRALGRVDGVRLAAPTSDDAGATPRGKPAPERLVFLAGGTEVLSFTRAE